jgi:hypothetical protein
MYTTITVAIPLHKSSMWVDNIVANVENLSPLVTEILISDQTCLDDAADQLRIRLAGNPRVIIHSRASGLGFAEHYQYLLESASGDLFMWMPHDDIFEPSWIPTLAAALEEHPEAWLAFGKLHTVEVDGVTPLWPLILPVQPGLLSLRQAIRMMVFWTIWSPFRGLFRRKNVLDAKIPMDPVNSLTAIDIEWVFTVALHGKLIYNNNTTTWKRLYEGSTHRTTLWQEQMRGNVQQAAIRILDQYGPGGMYGSLLWFYVWFFYLVYSSHVWRVIRFIIRKFNL